MSSDKKMSGGLVQRRLEIFSLKLGKTTLGFQNQLKIARVDNDVDETLLRKHRKNCECCPGHYLIVNHYSSMS